MPEEYQEVRMWLKSVRTRRNDFEQYMEEMADLHKQVYDDTIDASTFKQYADEIESKYVGRIHHDDCREFKTEADYKEFIDILKDISPSCASAFDEAFEHEKEHAEAIDGMEGIEKSYGLWMLLEDDDSVSTCPYVKIAGKGNKYFEARQSSLKDVTEPSPLDKIESD